MEEKSAVFFTNFLTNWANSDTTPCGATQRDRKTQELSDRRQARRSTRHALGRTRDAVDLPDLSGEGDEVRGVPDELERGRLVQTVHDEGEGAVPVDLDERAGVVLRRSSRRAPDREDTLREGVETVAAAKFHVNEEGGARSHLRGGGRLRPERYNLAVLGQVGNRAGLGHVHRIALHLQPGRDDVVEW